MTTAQSISLTDLQGVDIFTGLSNQNLEEIAECCIQFVFRAGEYAAVQGKTTDHLLIVNGGKVTIETWIEVPRHSYTLTITTLTKGRVCAWSALVPPHVLTASVKCVEKTPMIAMLAKDLQHILTAKPVLEATVMRNLAGIISSRLRDSHTQLTSLCTEVLKEGIRHRE